MKSLTFVWSCLFLLMVGTCLDAGATLRMALLGDSMTWIGGESCDKESGWTSHFKAAVDSVALDVYARSGATWTNTRNTTGDVSHYSEILDDENVVYAQALRLVRNCNADPTATPAIILIYAGANDAWFAERRPGIFDDDTVTVKRHSPSECTSLKSSIELVCDTLTEQFPDSKIVLMTPVEMTKTSVERINKVGDIIEETGLSLGIRVLRADKDVEIRKEVESNGFKYTSDGVHTNPAGAAMIARYIQESLF